MLGKGKFIKIKGGADCEQGYSIWVYDELPNTIPDKKKEKEYISERIKVCNERKKEFQTR